MLHYVGTVIPSIEEFWFIMEVKTQDRSVEEKRIVSFGSNEEDIRARCLLLNSIKDDYTHYEVIQGDYRPV